MRTKVFADHFVGEVRLNNETMFILQNKIYRVQVLYGAFDEIHLKNIT